MTLSSPARTGLALAALLSAPALAQDDIEIEIEATEPRALPSAEPDIAPVDETAALRETVARLEARLVVLETQAPPEAPPSAPAPPDVPEEATPIRKGLLGAVTPLQVRGYIQTQYRSSQLSEDEVDEDGAPMNKDQFSIRRGRLAVQSSSRYAGATLEVDINTVAGPFVSPSQADVEFMLPHPDPEVHPYLVVSGGLSSIPFGVDLPQGSRGRLFMERTQGSRALFPGERDIGIQLATGLGPLRGSIAAQNGVPISNTPTDALVFTARPTLIGRVGAVASVKERASIGGGLSYLSGGGLHEGSTSSKTALSWSDKNQNGLVSLDELVGVNSQSASPSIPFDRWAIGADVQLGLRTPLGWTRVDSEVIMASNLDRGYLVADPVTAGYDLRELAWHVGIVQEVLDHGLVGARVDSYDPNTDAFATQRGEFIDADLDILTIAPALGLQVKGRGRLVFQYDYVVDLLGRDVIGVAIDLPNDQWTLRAQMEF